MYIIEGNIGAGKSTFLKLLESHIPEVAITLKSSEYWQNSDYGQSLLINFYQQPKRWAYTLETLTMANRVRDHQFHQHNKNKNIILERSIYSGHHCFARNSYENGFMTPVEWEMYNQLFNFLIPHTCKAPLGFIYLKVNPEIAYERIKTRSQANEKSITLEYLRQIDQKHESFLITEKKALPHISITPVLVLDCDQEFESNTEKLNEHITRVKQFLASTQNTFTPAKPDWQMLRRAPIVDDELFNI